MSTDFKLFTVKEAAKFMRVKENTLRVWQKMIPEEIYIRAGKRVLYIEPRFKEWVLNGCKMSKNINLDCNK